MNADQQGDRVETLEARPGTLNEPPSALSDLRSSALICGDILPLRGDYEKAHFGEDKLSDPWYCGERL
jgi:hypothetical protein